MCDRGENKQSPNVMCLTICVHCHRNGHLFSSVVAGHYGKPDNTQTDTNGGSTHDDLARVSSREMFCFCASVYVVRMLTPFLNTQAKASAACYHHLTLEGYPRRARLSAIVHRHSFGLVPVVLQNALICVTFWLCVFLFLSSY